MNSWAHRHRIKRAIEESKSNRSRPNVINVIREPEANNSLRNTSIGEHSPPDEPIETHDCDLCLGGTQHRCRLCDTIVCVLRCSIPDPDSDNESHRIHKPGD